MGKKSQKKTSAKANVNTHKTAEKEPFYLFVKDQGEGAVRGVVIALKIISLILTSIFGLCLGILGPVVIWNGDDIVDEAIAENPAVMFWLISSIIYIVGTFILMLGHSKTALAVHAAAAVLTLITYYNFMVLFALTPDNNGPTGLYMPCLFIMVISAVIMLLINLPKWIEKRSSRENAKAPSILADDEED